MEAEISISGGALAKLKHTELLEDFGNRLPTNYSKSCGKL